MSISSTSPPTKNNNPSSICSPPSTTTTSNPNPDTHPIMAEPQPSTIHEGASTPPAPQKPPAAASEAAALSSLDNKTISSDAANNGPKKEVDLKALNDAMKALDAGSGKKATATAGAAGAKKDEEPAKLIKVDAADVALVVSRISVPTVIY